VVGFFRRHWRLVFGTAFAFGLVTAVAVVLFVPRSWQASATLVIVPPKFASELAPGTLTVQGYQQLLASDAVLAEAKRRLVEAGRVEPDLVLRIGRNVETRIFVARRAEELELAPMVEAIARGRTPEQAAAIANTWAEVFLDRTNELMAGTTSSTVAFIEAEYPEARAALAQLERDKVEEANRLQTSLDEAAARWSHRITGFDNETAGQIAGFRAETRALIEAYQGEKALGLRRARIDSLRTTYSELQQEQARVSSRLQLRRLELAAARQQLTATPQFITLQKAITDEALWQRAGGSTSEPDWKALKERMLLTQEANPVFTALAARVSELEVEVVSLEPRADELSHQLEEIAAQLKSLDLELRADEAGLELLERQREAALAVLTATRANERAGLERLEAQEITALERGRGARLAQLDRDIDQQRRLFEDLAGSYNQAQLAKSQRNIESVRLGAAAQPPSLPERRGAALSGILAALVGGILAIGRGLTKEL